MKNNILLIALVLMLFSCKKGQTPEPDNLIKYKVTCQTCTVFFTTNTHRQIVNVSGVFEYKFYREPGIYVSLRVEAPEYKAIQHVTMSINDLSYSALMGVGNEVGKELVWK